MAFNNDRESIPGFGNDLGVYSTETVDTEALNDFLSSDEEIEDLENPKPVKKVAPVKTAASTDKKVEIKSEENEETGPSAEEELDDFLNEGENSKKETSKVSKETKDEPVTEPDESQFSILSKELFNLGVFTFDEEETEDDVKIETPEEFRDRFEYEKKKGAGQALEAFLSRFGEPYAQFFDSVFVNGVDPIEYLQSYSKIENLRELDLTQESNQERIVREKLSKDGYEPEDIESEITRLKNYNDLESRSKADHKVLIKQEERAAQQREETKKQELQREAAKKQHYVASVRQILADKIQKKDFDGIPVDRQFAEDVAGYLTKERFKLQGGKLITEFEKEILDLDRPENFNLKVKVGMLMKLLKKDPTLSKIQKKAVSKEANELFGRLKKVDKTNKQQNIEKETSTGSWFEN